MFWYSKLLSDEFLNYFRDEDSVYFTVSSRGKIYNDIYVKFKDTVQCLMILFSINNFEDSLYYKIYDKESSFYKLAETFFKDKRRPVFKEVYHSISGNVYNCDIASLSADQLAVGLMFPFASRMGRSFEDDFAESGRLRQFLLALYDKDKSVRLKNEITILENMTVSEKHNYERMKKRGYTDEEIKDKLLRIRRVPQELKEEAYRAIGEKLIMRPRKEDIKTFEQKKQEMLAITDPRQAYIEISTDEELSLMEMHEITMAYREKHGVGMEEMAFYPNGERVLKAEMFY